MVRTSETKIKFCTTNKMFGAHLKSPLIKCLCVLAFCPYIQCCFINLLLCFCIYIFFYLCLIRLGCFLCSLPKRHQVQIKKPEPLHRFVGFFVLLLLSFSLTSDCLRQIALVVYFCLFSSIFAQFHFYLIKSIENQIKT